MMATRTRIVVGIDGSAESQAALVWAVHEAERTGAEIDAVLAYDSGLAWIDVGSEYQAVIVEQSAKRAGKTCTGRSMPSPPCRRAR